MSLFYKPTGAGCGDFIPYYHNGVYYLNYIHVSDDHEENEHNGLSWRQVVTRDFVTFEEWGISIPAGTVNEQDFLVFTGSIIEHDKKFHCFYTGHNSHLRKQGKPEQVILHAVSDDLRSWDKDRDFFFPAPPEYWPHDWRDPYVYRDEKTGDFRMVITARKIAGPGRSRHGGVLAMATSKDLRHWQVIDDFWTPDQYYTMECPDLFQIGDFHYLFFSENVNRFATCYRMAPAAVGPWRKPADDMLDATRGWYAAKTAGLGGERYAFGWMGTKRFDNEDLWDGSGALVVHKLVPRQDGSLMVQPPQALLDSFTQTLGLPPPRPIYGEWNCSGTHFACASAGRFSLLDLGPVPECCLIEIDVDYATASSVFAVNLRADETFSHYNQLRIEPARRRMVTDARPRQSDQAFSQERHLPMTPGVALKLQLFIDGSAMVVYADNAVAMCDRLFFQSGTLALGVVEGEAQFHVTVKVEA